jgi:hypothetical protein
MNENTLWFILRKTQKALGSIYDDIHAIREQAYAKKNEKQPPIEVDIKSEVRLPVAVTEYYDSENREGPKGRSRDLMRLALESLALTAAIIAAVFAGRTFTQVRRQADAAQRQIGIMQRQMVLDQRAWIVVRYPTITLQDNMPLTVPLTVENIGKTLAKNISGVISVYPLRRGTEPDLSYAPGHTH